MRRLIVVEGMDNTGKTTLVNKLAHKTGYTVIPSRGPDKDQVREWLKMALQKAMEDDVIFDRISLVSEEIYGPLLRGGSVFEPKEWDKLWAQFMLMNPAIIYCRPPREAIYGSISDREQMEGVSSNCSTLVDGYDYFFRMVLQNHSTPFHVYDYTTDPDLSQVLKYLTEAGAI